MSWMIKGEKKGKILHSIPSTKGQEKKKKGKGGKKSKVDPKNIYNYYKEPSH